MKIWLSVPATDDVYCNTIGTIFFYTECFRTIALIRILFYFIKMGKFFTFLIDHAWKACMHNNSIGFQNTISLNFTILFITFLYIYLHLKLFLFFFLFLRI